MPGRHFQFAPTTMKTKNVVIWKTPGRNKPQPLLPQQMTYITQVSPEKVDPRKVDINFLEANIEYFRVLEAKEDL